MTHSAEHTIKQIAEILQQQLAPECLNVTDTSGAHRGHGGYREGELTHLRIEVTAQSLTDMSKLAAHRKIYAILTNFIDAGLHAIEIKIR